MADDSEVGLVYVNSVSVENLATDVIKYLSRPILPDIKINLTLCFEELSRKVDKENTPYCLDRIVNKSSAVAEMGDRLATICMGRKWGGAAVGSWVPI